MDRRKPTTRLQGGGSQTVIKPRPEGKRTDNATAQQGAARFELAPPQVGKRIVFHCSVCGHEADATYIEKYGRREWAIGSRVDRCPGRGECLRAIAEWLRAPSAAAFKTDPRPWLAQVAEFTTQREGDAESLPSTGYIEGWHSRLLATAHPFEYLTCERGLTVETIARYQLGWDGDEHTLTLPVYDSAGELVNVRRRRVGPGEPFRGLRGRGSQLYPDVPPGGILLAAGEFDVLAARQHGAGCPEWSGGVVTTTCGASLPDHLAAELAGRSVAVAYDVGEEAAAERTVAKLRSLACESWVVRLELLGLPPGGDLNDFFRDRGTARELAHLIRRERGRS
jgi:hypothetical protein